MSPLKTKKEAEKILSRLKKLFPDAGMILRYSNNWELLVAVMLSAQCTDKKVNEVTKQLFKTYKKLNQYAKANIYELEQSVHQTGFYKQKARRIKGSAQMIRDVFNGEVPRTMEEMLALPGVARKTANVVLGNAYGVVEGIAVDTHVKRFVKRFGFSQHTGPEKIEQDLMKLFPKKEWFRLTYLMIEFGRKYCPARSHDHAECKGLLGL